MDYCIQGSCCSFPTGVSESVQIDCSNGFFKGRKTVWDLNIVREAFLKFLPLLCNAFWYFLVPLEVLIADFSVILNHVDRRRMQGTATFHSWLLLRAPLETSQQLYPWEPQYLGFSGLDSKLFLCITLFSVFLFTGHFQLCFIRMPLV